MSQKVVVIIGASFGGRMIAQGLLSQKTKNFKIVLIDKQNYFEFICSNYKSLVDENYFDKISIKHENTHLPAGLEFVQGTLTSIDENQN